MRPAFVLSLFHPWPLSYLLSNAVPNSRGAREGANHYIGMCNFAWIGTGNPRESEYLIPGLAGYPLITPIGRIRATFFDNPA